MSRDEEDGLFAHEIAACDVLLSQCALSRTESRALTEVSAILIRTSRQLRAQSAAIVRECNARLPPRRR
jgi:hypothetical protein